MTSNEINAVIDNLCSKLGTAKEVLLPEMARMYTISSAFNTAVCAVALAVLLHILKRNLAKIENDIRDNDLSYDERQNAEIITAISGALSLGFFVGFWVNAYNLAQWISSPTAKTFEYILQLL